MEVGDGELLAILGPNGSGKTTLLRVLAGLLPLDDGRVSIDGVVVDEPATDRFVPPEARSVGVVFQDYLLFDHLSVLDNVAFGLREHGARRAAARERARMLLTEVGVEAQAAARPRELSGGQAQRVALARALATEPSLLLLDEPLAALDVQTRGETRRQLQQILGRFRGTRILVTHDPVDALVLADRILILEAGAVVQTGTPDEITSRPRSEYVAELVGVNLYRGRAVGDEVQVGDAVVTVATECTGDVTLIIPPNAVVLHPDQPSGSARNVWRGTIAGIEYLGTRERVRVRVVGALTIVAEVTPAAVQALALDRRRRGVGRGEGDRDRGVPQLTRVPVRAVPGAPDSGERDGLGGDRPLDAEEHVDLRRADRVAVQEALGEVVVEADEVGGLLRGLDALGDARVPHDRRDRGHALHDRPHAFLVQSGDEAAVDFHDVHRESLQVCERRVAGAEVVDRDADAEGRDVVDEVLPGDLVDQHRLGELQHQLVRRETGARERGLRSRLRSRARAAGGPTRSH